jgi:hypothetical protein
MSGDSVLGPLEILAKKVMLKGAEGNPKSILESG